MKQPGWLLEHLKKNDKPFVKEQITIISKSPVDSGRLSELMGSPISSMVSRNSGAGVDGIIQPGKMAGYVDEGERVLNANASQAIDDETFGELSRQAEAGTLNINALRKALELPPVQKYQTGTGFYPAGVTPSPAPSRLKINNPSAVPSTTSNSSGSSSWASPIAGAVKGLVGNTVSKVVNNAQSGKPQWVDPIAGAVRGLIDRSTSKVIDKVQQADNSKTWGGRLINNMTSAADAINKISSPGSIVQSTGMGPVVAEKKPTGIPINLRTEPTAVTSEAAPAAPVALPAPANQNIGTAINIPVTGTTTEAAAPGPYETVINSSLRNLVNTSEGKNPYDRQIANRNLRDYDTRASNQLYADRMGLSTQRNVPDNLKNSLMAQEQSGIRSGRSELIGTMAANQAQRAEEANVAAANMAAGERSFQTNQGNINRAFNANQEQVRRQNTLSDIDALVKAGVGKNANAIVSKFAEIGVNINPADLVSGEKADKFSRGMSLITSGIASGMNPTDIRRALSASGLLDVMSGLTGGTQGQWTGDPALNPVSLVKSGKPIDSSQLDWLIDNNYTATGEPVDTLTGMINRISGTSNPIDQSWRTIETSQWYQSLPQEKRQSTKALYDFVTSGGDLPYNVKQKSDGTWEVIPKTDAELTGNYTGNVWSEKTTNILNNKNDPQYSAAVKATVADIQSRGDVSKLLNLPNDSPARTNIMEELGKNAKAWSGGANRNWDTEYTGTTEFTDPPAQGSIISWNNQLYYVKTPVQQVGTSGGNWQDQYFYATNLGTGDNVKFSTPAGQLKVEGDSTINKVLRELGNNFKLSSGPLG